MAEIKSMRRVVALAGGAMPFYCFIDEVLKGTNTASGSPPPVRCCDTCAGPAAYAWRRLMILN